MTPSAIRMAYSSHAIKAQVLSSVLDVRRNVIGIIFLSR
jgi:hypothetical protein